ncbi:MAG TPA: cbb3-type cytochrome c oxidase subunit I [Candidatus Limnocylindrales bacterium]|nr:cbb3-type cytochrome c oxidase subunit I [Candidatus Limnocylindrales bacterium]
MVVSLPISAAVESPPRQVIAGTAQLGVNAPSVALPLAFILTGLLALITGSCWLLFRPDLLATYHYNQYIIAVTHLFVLGWICSIIVGAMYQLVPVALETRLYSERLAWWHFIFHIVGFIGMVCMFRIWNMKQVGHFGSGLAFGLGLFVYNMVRTLRRVPRWNVTATAVAAALAWIALTITAGLSLAIGKCTYESTSGLATAGGVRTLVSGLRSIAGFMSHFDAISAMHAHAHLGAVGLFTILLIGVSYKLIPMFTLSEVQSRRRAGTSVALLNLGLAGSFVTILWRSPWKFGFALMIVVALGIYGWELGAILRARKRKSLDWGIKYFLTAIMLLLPVSALALVLSWPRLPLNPFTGQLENVYGFVGLIGVVTFAVMGMLYKIIPFLVWYGQYSQHIGHAQVPSLADLYSSRLQAVGYFSFVVGVAVTSAAIAGSSATIVRAGCLLLMLSVATLAVNVAMILSHLLRPRLKPLVSISATRTRAST